MEEKVKVGLFLPKSLMEKIRSLIHQKYDKYEKGLLSYEAEMALRHWLSLHTQAQNTLETRKPNPTPRVALVFAEAKNYLLNNWYYELKLGQQIPKVHIEKAIMEVRGSDKRTINKWLKTFHKMGLVKPITSVSWEVL